MAITVSEATDNGAYYVFGSSDDNNTVYGTDYAETFIFTGKSNNLYYGTTDFSGDFTIEDVSDGDMISVDSLLSSHLFDLSIRSEGNSVILVNKPSSYSSYIAQVFNDPASTGTGTYNLNALSNGETIMVNLGDLEQRDYGNLIQISAVGEDLFYNYIGSAFTLNTEYYDFEGYQWVNAYDVNVFEFGGYEYGQRLITSDAAAIGQFHNGDQNFDETKFYAQQNTATAALSFVADNNNNTNPITFTFNQNLDGENDGTATFSQGAVNAFVMSHTDMNMGTMAPAIDDFTPADAKATTHVDLATVQSIHLDDSQLLNTTAVDLMYLVDTANDGVADGNFALTGAGNNDYIHIDHLESVLDADLSFISGVSHIESLVSLTDNTVAFTGNLGNAASNIVTIEGTAGGADDIFNIDGATLSGWTSFDIDANAILQGSASHLHMITATGAGKVEVFASGSDAIDDTAYYLTNISTDISFANNAIELNNTAELDIMAGSIGVAPLTVTGNGLANALVVSGTADNDTIDMSSVTATNARIVIYGDVGKDTMTGANGVTSFFFIDGHTASTTTDADVIVDLAVGDTIDLGYSSFNSTYGGVFSHAAKASALNGNAAAVGLAGLDDTKFDAWVTSDADTEHDYLVYETQPDGSTTEMIDIGVTAPGTLSAWTMVNGLISVVAGTFTVAEDSSTHNITFGGNATGAVTLTTDGTNLTFARGGITAVTTPALATVGTIPDVTTTVAHAKTVANANKWGATNVTLSDAASAADLDTIATATTGIVTATLAANTAISDATVAALSHVDANDVITFASTAITADATALITLNTLADVKSYAALATITEAAADIGASAVAITDALAIKDAAVTITGTISAADANTIANVRWWGIVTATVTATGDVATLNTALVHPGANDALTLVLDATTADIKDLNVATGLNGKTSVDIDARTITSITDTTGVNVIDLTTAGITYHASNAITVTGGTGADTITGRDSSIADTFVLASSGDSASVTVTVDTNTANATITIPVSGVDTIHGEAADIIDLAGTSGWGVVSGITVVANGSIDTDIYATTSLDAFMFSDSGNFYLAYETGAGSSGTFGVIEIVKIVGVVDANDTFAVSAAGAVTFAAVAN